MHLMKKFMFFIAVSICCYIVILYAIQDYLIFHPHGYHQTPAEANLQQFREVQIPSFDNTKLRIWLADGNKQKPTILFFHGNAYQNSFFAQNLLPFIKEGYTVAMMEYRGFGGTDGHLHQSNVFKDASVVFDWLKQQNYPHIIVYGYSFGCAVSVGLTTIRTPDKLILTAPFASLIGLVKEKPVPFAGMVLRDYYPSDDFIKNYKGPLLIIHGLRDRLIPYHHSEILYENSPSAKKTLVLLKDTGHRSVFLDEKNLPYIIKWLNKNITDDN